MDIWMILALLFFGFVAIVAELFIPSGGLLGLLGFVAMLVSVVFAYKDYGALLGTFLLAVVIIGTPVLIMIGFKIFPHTLVGKRLILADAQKQETGYTSYTDDLYKNLLGAEGIALTSLRPSGMARLNDQKYSVVCQAGLISPGTKVKVVGVEGSRIVVRKA